MQENPVWMLTGQGFVSENPVASDRNFKILSNHSRSSYSKKRHVNLVDLLSMSRKNDPVAVSTIDCEIEEQRLMRCHEKETEQNETWNSNKIT